MDLALCSHFKVLPTEDRWKNLSFLQKIILYKEITKDKEETSKIINDILESLQPWLDKDLWTNIKEAKTDVKINENWDKVSSENLDDGDILEEL